MRTCGGRSVFTHSQSLLMGAIDMKSALRGGSIQPLGLSFLTIAVFLALLAPGTFADVNGRVRGTVLDPSGAAVADARVKIMHVATNLERTMRTTGLGTFDAPNHPPGTHTVTGPTAGAENFNYT